MKGCAFNRFSGTNDWDRCRFTSSKLNGFNGGRFSVKNGEFADCSLFGFRNANLQLDGCTFDGTELQGNWWEPPSDFVFRDCAIKTRDDVPFLRLGGYSVGKVGFDGCAVSGKRGLVFIKDLRRIQLPPNADPAANPDRMPGTIAFRRTKWTGEARTVLSCVKDANPSPKRISVLDKDNAWPAGVSVASELPANWEVKFSNQGGKNEKQRESP